MCGKTELFLNGHIMRHCNAVTQQYSSLVETAIHIPVSELLNTFTPGKLSFEVDYEVDIKSPW